MPRLFWDDQYMYIFVYVYVFYLGVCVDVRVRVFVCIYVCICICVRVYTCACGSMYVVLFVDMSPSTETLKNIYNMHLVDFQQALKSMGVDGDVTSLLLAAKEGLLASVSG